LGIFTAQEPADRSGTAVAPAPAGAFLPFPFFLAIRGLLLWVLSANTIMTGGRLSRKRRN
jgi:hypothetical protein